MIALGFSQKEEEASMAFRNAEADTACPQTQRNF